MPPSIDNKIVLSKTERKYKCTNIWIQVCVAWKKVLRYNTKAQSESNTLVSGPIITNWNKEMDI